LDPELKPVLTDLLNWLLSWIPFLWLHRAFYDTIYIFLIWF